MSTSSRLLWQRLAGPRHLSALVLISATLLAAPALAEDPASCTTDADCGEGQSCVVVGESCSGSSDPNTEPTCTTESVCMVPQEPDFNECQEDSDCPGSFKCQSVGEVCMGGGSTVEPDGSERPPGESQEPSCQTYFMCVPPPPPTCTSSADCSGGLTCTSFTFQECSGGDPTDPVPVGTDGSKREPPQDESGCTTSTESYCVPPYIGECQADADCGPGFTCEEELTCPPCARPEPGSGDGDDDGVSCSAECAASGERYCKLQEITCAADADCPSNFTCETFDAPDIAIAPACDPDGSDCDDTTPPPQPEPERLCMPPAWDTWIAPGGTSGGNPTSNDDSPSYDERLTGSTGKSNGWKLVETSQAPASGTNSANGDGGGCSTAPTPASPAPAAGLGLLGLLGMMLVRRRR